MRGQNDLAGRKEAPNEEVMARTPGWCAAVATRGSTLRVFVSGPGSDRQRANRQVPRSTVWTVYPANVNSDQIGAGVKAGIRAINENGGLAGHPVVVKECKTDLTPQGEIQCYQQAADDPAAVALVSPLVIIAQDDTNAILEEAGLPAINSNPDTPATLSGLMQFPLGQASVESARLRSAGVATPRVPSQSRSPVGDPERARAGAGGCCARRRQRNDRRD